MSAPRPPRLLEACAARLLASAPDAEAALGDLCEGFASHAARHGAPRATWWYARQVASLSRHRGSLAGAAPDGGRGGLLDRMARDLRHAVRAARRRPGHSLGVSLLLAVSVAATTAALSVTLGTLEAARWWAAEERAVYVWPEYPFSRGQLDVLRTETSAFEVVGGILRRPVLVRADERTLPTTGAALSPELFQALRQTPLLGRALETADALPGAEPVVVLGHGLWQGAFGGRRAALGSVVDVGGVRRRVVGIMPPGAEQPGPGTALWTPLTLDAGDPEFWPARELEVVGLMRPGVTPLQAQADVRRVLGDLAERFAFFFRADFGMDATVLPARARTWGAVATPLLLLLAGTVLLLLVAAIDVGHLALARSVERYTELRVRASVGATRAQIIQQMAAEAALFALAAAGLGWSVGALLAPRLSTLFPAGAPVASAPPLTPALVLFGLGATLLAWLLMAAIPALHFLASTRSGVVVRRGRRRAAHGLVVAQAALSTTLLVVAALLLRTVAGLAAVPLGFDPAGVSAVAVSPGAAAPPPAALEAIRDNVARALSGGGATAGWVSTVPFLDAAVTSPVHTDSDDLEVAAAPTAVRLVADGGALDALGARLLAGRTLRPGDAAGTAPVALLSAGLARLLWGDTPAVGRRIAVDPHGWDRWIQVVGVLEDIQVADLTSAPPPLYIVPRHQAAGGTLSLVVRGGEAPATVAAATRAALRSAAPEMATGSGRALVGLVRDAQGQARVLTSLLGALAVLATVLGAAGLHGALAAWVARRRAELGTRMALGATPWRLSAGVLGTALGLTAAGVAVGALGAAAAGRAVRGLLFAVSPVDPAAYLMPAALLLATALGAAALPALRAGSVAPADALRDG